MGGFFYDDHMGKILSNRIERYQNKIPDCSNTVCDYVAVCAFKHPKCQMINSYIVKAKFDNFSLT